VGGKSGGVEESSNFFYAALHFTKETTGPLMKMLQFLLPARPEFRHAPLKFKNNLFYLKKGLLDDKFRKFSKKGFSGTSETRFSE